MKSFIRILPLLLVMLLGHASGADPVIGAIEVTSLSDGKATAKVTVTTTDEATTVAFTYQLLSKSSGTPTAPEGVVVTTATTTVPVNKVEVVSKTLENLVGGRTYRVQAQASNVAAVQQPKDFVVPAYAGKPTTGMGKSTGSTAVLNGTVTANGKAGTVHFEYGPDDDKFGFSVTPDKPIGQTQGKGGDVEKDSLNATVTAMVSNLTRNITYHFRLVFINEAGQRSDGEEKTFLTDNAPVANTDTVNLTGAASITIRPLANDTDPDHDTFSLLSVDEPENGKAVIAGDTIIYTPGANAQAFEDFAYTIKEDLYDLTATGKISIRSVRAGFSGTHGGFIKRANGKEAGYFQVNATPMGTFTGTAIIEGKRYAVTGMISPDGDYTGFAIGGKSVLPVSLSIDQTDTDSVVNASFDNGRWTSDVTLAPSEGTTRAEAAGRYTVELPGGTATESGTDRVVTPEGTGWAALTVNEDGTAKIKGRLSDGRSFSSRGTVTTENDGAVVTFFEGLEDTRVVGSFSLGDAVSGSLHVDRKSSDDQRFPGGYDVSQSVSGARYIPPQDGQRALDSGGAAAKELNITFSGGDLSGDLVRHLRLNDDDDVTVTNRGSEQLKVSIDRKSGRFKAGVTIDTAGTRVKGNGVLIQDSGTATESGGRGAGVFNGSVQTGRIEIAPGAATSTTTARAAAP